MKILIDEDALKNADLVLDSCVSNFSDLLEKSNNIYSREIKFIKAKYNHERATFYFLVELQNECRVWINARLIQDYKKYIKIEE